MARVKLSDELDDLMDDIEDLSSGLRDTRSEADMLSDLFDDPAFSYEIEEEDEV